VVLTGAGISAESGVPTFRGPEGYWTVGSRNYRPEDLATFSAFRRMPEEVWGWCLYRRGVYRSAEPNAAHRALVDLDRQLGSAFQLVTQNVDGLHLRAGSPPERTFQIHGNLDYVRCAAGCSTDVRPVPDGVDVAWDRERRLGQIESEQLRCECGSWLRPHVLWFDEYYDEERYRFESSLRAADQAALLLVVGTSGATNLPNQMCERVYRRGGAMVVVNRDPSPFSAMAERSDAGFFARGSAGDWIGRIAEYWAAGP
jgi:NAD-dependent deacetylase